MGTNFAVMEHRVPEKWVPLSVIPGVTMIKLCQLCDKNGPYYLTYGFCFLISDQEDTGSQSPTRSTTPKHPPMGTITSQLSSQSDDVRDEEGGFTVSSPSPVASQRSSVPFQACDVGSFTDAAVPLVYCSRHLAASFLLTGCAGFTMPDSSVRVSVKALALNCIASILHLSPDIIFVSVDKNKDPNGIRDGNKIYILFCNSKF